MFFAKVSQRERGIPACEQVRSCRVFAKWERTDESEIGDFTRCSIQWGLASACPACNIILSSGETY